MDRRDYKLVLFNIYIFCLFHGFTGILELNVNMLLNQGLLTFHLINIMPASFKYCESYMLVFDWVVKTNLAKVSAPLLKTENNLNVSTSSKAQNLIVMHNCSNRLR